MGNTNSDKNNNNNNKIEIDKEKYDKYLDYVKKQRIIEKNRKIKKNNDNESTKIVNIELDSKKSHINVEKKKLWK